jgi:hypothetical protein
MDDEAFTIDDETFAEVKRILVERDNQSKADQFKAWGDELAATPRSWKPTLKAGYVADMELQPHWWLGEGVTLMECCHIDSQVELMNGGKGAVLSSHLPYPIFLAAVESFLKGMYLCRFAECRQIASSGYIRPLRRLYPLKAIKKFGHHLPNLIKALKRVKAYRTDAACMRFLNILDGLVRRFYYPAHAADENHGWATARYPKRFYNDQTKQGSADGYRSFPQQALVIRLFQGMNHYLDKKWNLRHGLIERRKARRARIVAKAARSVTP